MKILPHTPLDRLRLFSLRGIQMRTFHLSWLMFFVCFFGWFGLAPLMPAIRADMGLSKTEVGTLIIVSVSTTIVGRLLAGYLCERWGPRKTAVRLLLLGALPLFLVGLARDYHTMLLFRGAIGLIGASFVITQFHTASLFSPRLKGRAAAIAGGWGNLGGGVANLVMPLLFAAIVGMGYTGAQAWRYAMILPGLLMLLLAWLYHRYAGDPPPQPPGRPRPRDRSLWRDRRVWALTLAYGMCFGVEITFDNVAALHFVDHFGLSQTAAGAWAGAFGAMNLFARALGGYGSDRAGRRGGLSAKGKLLALLLALEGLALIAFARSGSLAIALVLMLAFAFFLKMANGATYGMVPFLHEKHAGLVGGIVGAGGNAGGMLFGFFFRAPGTSYTQAFTWIGILVLASALTVGLTRFRPAPRADSAPPAHPRIPIPQYETDHR